MDPVLFTIIRKTEYLFIRPPRAVTASSERIAEAEFRSNYLLFLYNVLNNNNIGQATVSFFASLK